MPLAQVPVGGPPPVQGQDFGPVGAQAPTHEVYTPPGKAPVGGPPQEVFQPVGAQAPSNEVYTPPEKANCPRRTRRMQDLEDTPDKCAQPQTPFVALDTKDGFAAEGRGWACWTSAPYPLSLPGDDFDACESQKRASSHPPHMAGRRPQSSEPQTPPRTPPRTSGMAAMGSHCWVAETPSPDRQYTGCCPPLQLQGLPPLGIWQPMGMP